ncbi:MAG: D-Ala-D-Ala carboxypeptidase family metallohydrolase [Gemmatimonadaceae bacterium]
MLLATFVVGWTWSVAIASARTDDATGITEVTARITSALTTADAPSAAYLTDVVLDAFAPLRGESGRLHVQFREPGEVLVEDTLPAGTSVHFSTGEVADSVAGDSLLAPEEPGIWRVAVKLGEIIRPMSDFNVITMLPFSEKQRGRIGLYYLGSWPNERNRARARYAPPRGFIEVTPENRDTPVSDHFTLGSFLTKNQPNVWPKYLVLETRLLDKLELVLEDLRLQGITTRGVQVMSGFRTPQYNRRGGNTAGRASLSRHMYGDAADIYIDNDGNGVMDDLNGDGRITIADARVIQSAVDRVEREHPSLIGGTGVYAAGSGHGPFTHIDTRGYRARWIGTGAD